MLNARGSTLVIAIVLALLIETVLIYVVMMASTDSKLSASTRRQSSRSALTSELQAMFSDNAQCLGLLRASGVLVGPTSAVPANVSRSLAALTTGAGPRFATIRYAPLLQIGPMMVPTSGPETFLADYWASQPSPDVKYDRAMLASFQPWWRNPVNAATANLTSPPSSPETPPATVDYRTREGVVDSTAGLRRTAYVSMLDQDSYIERLTLIETAMNPVPNLDASSGAPIVPFLNKPVAGSPGQYLNAAPGFSRAFHVWADFGMAQGSSAPALGSRSVLDLAVVTSDGTPSGSPIGCAVFASAIGPAVNSRAPTNPFSWNCGPGEILEITGTVGSVASYRCGRGGPSEVCPGTQLPSVDASGRLTCM